MRRLFHAGYRYRLAFVLITGGTFVLSVAVTGAEETKHPKYNIGSSISVSLFWTYLRGSSLPNCKNIVV